jgi:SAM-dependent methyltransferase
MHNEKKDTDISALEVVSTLKNYNTFVIDIMTKNMKFGRVLDFGCGYGEFANQLNKMGYDCDGVEVNLKAISKAKELGVKIFSGLNELKRRYPIVTSLNVLEHIEDDEKVLKDLFEIIEDNGTLILYLPASLAAWTDMDLQVGHYRRYSKKMIIEKLKNAGFEVIGASYKDFGGWLILIILKTLKIKPKFNLKLLQLYDKFVFPLIKYLDIFGSHIIGKNVLVVARVVR